MANGNLLELREMSKSTDTHNIKLTNLEIFVLEFILEDFDAEIELEYKDGKKVSFPKIIEGFVQKLKEAENENEL